MPLELPVEVVVVLREPGGDYPLKNGKTAFYVCRRPSCPPPTLYVERRNGILDAVIFTSLSQYT